MVVFSKEIVIRFTWADVGKAICFSPVLVAFGYGLICLPWSSPHATAWVQSIGAVAAVFVAIWVGQSQNKHRLLLDKQQAVDKARKLQALAAVVVPRAVNATLVYKGAPEVVVKRVAGAIKEDAKLLRQVGIAELPNDEIADAWFKLLGCVGAVEDDLSKLAGLLPGDDMERFSLQAAEHTLQELSAKLTEAVMRFEG